MTFIQFFDDFGNNTLTEVIQKINYFVIKRNYFFYKWKKTTFILTLKACTSKLRNGSKYHVSNIEWFVNINVAITSKH